MPFRPSPFHCCGLPDPAQCRSALAALDLHEQSTEVEWVHACGSQVPTSSLRAERCGRDKALIRQNGLVSTQRMHPPDGAAFSFVLGRHSKSTCGTAAFTWQVERYANNPRKGVKRSALRGK
eukprot:1219624-Amphidinium_carterae.1